jgi:hypothetical protein
MTYIEEECLPRDAAPIDELLALGCVPEGPATLSPIRVSDVEGPWNKKEYIFKNRCVTVC